MHRNPLIALLVLLLLASSQAAIARTGDTQQPIHIRADRAELDDRAGISVYQGNVIIEQGSLQITAERVEVQAKDKQLHLITAEGEQATLDQETDDGKRIPAEAMKMTYRADNRMILLEGNARLWQEGNEFASERIEYDTVNERVVAGTPSGQGRVEVIFHPEPPPGEEPPAQTPEASAPPTDASPSTEPAQ